MRRPPPRRSLLLSALLLSALVLLPLSGCVTLIDPTSAHVSWADERWPGTTLQDLEEARTLYLLTCTECHRARSPRRYEPDRWEFAIYRMLEGEDVDIEPDVISRIVLYLGAASALPTEKAVVEYEAARSGAGD